MELERPVDPESKLKTPYDFKRLEGSVGRLLKDHERLAAEHEALVFELVERQHKIALLEAELERERERRAQAVEVVDRVLDRVAGIEATLFSSAGTNSSSDSDSESSQEQAASSNLSEAP